ncbi:MAG: pyridoxamine 5'-phosphate oxidase family protein [Jaaginema sp. PMC 1079.18]|nr:pyridoxamine 5'-phosphate oxidase family protein [Jaaginema sp. PMC 1080.18]MEC4850890.1 pyridoxamine 5'-phosphate oxidase family protein [Jaaginema sp. PMC 1079.18]MEC4867585.1 pyridoxamine 5'-phosphate oxidase family protein [Jaaginema sp. PMC 1078.18]
MAKFYDQLTPELTAFIQQQHLFFTATAPVSGRINLSPKGLDTWRCLNPQTVAYLDLTGSGNETAAHLRENGRMTLMFCSFTEKPLILRLYGRGYTVQSSQPQWEELLTHFEAIPGMRQIVVLEIESVQTSCGFGVPLYDYQSKRETLLDFATQQGEEGIKAYQKRKNQSSIDGLPTGLLE